MEKVLEIVGLFYIPNITQDQVMLKAFPMSLTGSTSCWLRNKPFGSITIWEDLMLKCLSNYCPPALTAKKMEEINNFQQEPDETLYQSWERFKELLMKCLQHYLTEMQEDVKVPLILGRPFLSTVHAKIDVFKRKITLRVGDEKIIFKSVKSVTSLIKRVYMLSLRERMELNLEARLMGETLVLNKSLDPLYGDYIELNDLNVLSELRRDQVDDLMHIIEESEVIKEFRATYDARM
nr:hypothetical protein [Tanacetum cinerariifolium]